MRQQDNEKAPDYREYTYKWHFPPMVNHLKVRLHRRLYFAGLLFAIMVIAIYFTHGLLIFGKVFPAILPPAQNGILFIVIISFSIAFIDIVFILSMLTLLCEGLFLGIAYLISLTGLFSFASLWNWAKSSYGGTILTIIILIFMVFLYFRLWQYLPSRRQESQDYADYTDEEKVEPESKEDTKPEAPTHTKEELGRLLNLWQQKYSQAQTDEARKKANEMIMKYTDELKELKAQEGTTPDKSKRLNKGGESE